MVGRGGDVVDRKVKSPMRDGFEEWVHAAALWESSNALQSADRPAVEGPGLGYDAWLVEKKVRVKHVPWEDEMDVGDSCCFGTRTVEVGRDCIWKLHGGV